MEFRVSSSYFNFELFNYSTFQRFNISTFPLLLGEVEDADIA